MVNFYANARRQHSNHCFLLSGNARLTGGNVGGNCMKKCLVSWMISAVLLIAASGCSPSVPTSQADRQTYSLGRNPFSTEIVAANGTVYYKSLALYNSGEDGTLREYRYMGLSKKASASDTPDLIYDRFNFGLNVYKDTLYFIDTEYQLIQYDSTTGEAGRFRQDNTKAVQDALVINDALYFIEESDTQGEYQLKCYDLLTGEETMIAENISWEQLNHYQENVMVRSTDGTPQVYSAENHELLEVGPFEDMEVLQILDNGKVIGYSKGTFYECDLNGSQKRELFSASQIYNVIITQDNIYYSTVDEHAYTQTFAYSFSENKTETINTTEYPIMGYSDSILYCSGTAGSGYLYSLDTRTGVEEVFDYRVTE